MNIGAVAPAIEVIGKRGNRLEFCKGSCTRVISKGGEG